MINNEKWLSIHRFILENKCPNIYDPSTGSTTPIKNHKVITDAVLATAIETSTLFVRDTYGRIKPATNGGPEDIESRAYALQALGGYIRFTQRDSPDEIPDDHPFLENTPLNTFGWMDDALPDFDEINPHSPLPAIKTVAKQATVRSGITKNSVINAFEGLHFDRDQWIRALANVPNWLKDCRVTPGKRGNNKTSATWNPALIAVALLDKNVPIRKLDSVFVRLREWAEEWNDASANER
ncbi:hypothetical protein [Candidatus Nitrotoga sp. 1052]|uniref:hypothetical protein n=1 Tax=Candidatus Nitrotoga sp. 1052 TaxID=2886964 RepID=UPI001EF3E506|nr:hypothetical protein [Candidatus Nitrotoga sp. 1052]CAH1070402.1 hypothetical protein NTG1052_140128 [Candidatus Nitrotoga sp. 1052]